MNDPAGVRAGIEAAIVTLRALTEHADGLDQPAAQIKLAHVACALADARNALGQAAESLAARDRGILELRRAFARHDATTDHHRLRYRRSPEGKPIGKPFCSRCDEVEALILTHQPGDDCNEVFCPHCRARYPHVQTFLETDEIVAEARAA